MSGKARYVAVAICTVALAGFTATSVTPAAAQSGHADFAGKYSSDLYAPAWCSFAVHWLCQGGLRSAGSWRCAVPDVRPEAERGDAQLHRANRIATEHDRRRLRLFVGSHSRFWSDDCDRGRVQRSGRGE